MQNNLQIGTIAFVSLCYIISIYLALKEETKREYKARWLIIIHLTISAVISRIVC